MLDVGRPKPPPSNRIVLGLRLRAHAPRLVQVMAFRRSLVLALVVAVGVAQAFYLPGVPPRSYKRNEPVELLVNKIESVHTQLAFEYYSLPFCEPDKVKEKHENLGEVLAGDRLASSLYELNARSSEYCKVLCRRVYTAKEGQEFAAKIKEEYTVDWVLDNLPAAVRLFAQGDKSDVYYEREFPLGLSARAAQYLYNHIRFTVKYNPNEDVDGIRIVGFEVEPFRCALGGWSHAVSSHAACLCAGPATLTPLPVFPFRSLAV